MRRNLPDRLEAWRIRTGAYRSDASYGAYGAFEVPGPCGERLLIQASAADDDDPDAQGWEHVSVSIKRRIPNWIEMQFVKNLFWDEEEWVIQFHPPRSQYVNCHPHCLHLWRHKAGFPVPPSALVGPVPFQPRERMPDPWQKLTS